MAEDETNPTVSNGRMNDQPTSQQTAKIASAKQTALMGWSLVAFGILLAYLFLALWPSGLNPEAKGDAKQVIPFLDLLDGVTLDQRLLLMVLAAGGLGSFIHAATSFGDYVGNEKFNSNWLWWYILRPFIGMALAAIFYVAIRGGFLSAGTEAGNINPFGIAALAGLVGMFSKQATDKLNEVFNTLFRTAPNEGDSKRKDSLSNPVPSIIDLEPHTIKAGTKDVAVSVKGAGFVKGAVILINGVSRETTFTDASQLTAKLTSEDVTTEGEITVTVFNPAPGGGTSSSVKMTITAATQDAAKPESSDAESNIDGCDVPIQSVTSDEELPPTVGGVA